MKRVGALSFHPAFTPPSSGGELRLFHLLNRVAERGFAVELVSPTYGHHKQETIQHSPRFHETRFPKTNLYNKLHGTFDRVCGFSECSGLVCSFASQYHEGMKKEAQSIALRSDIFVHEYAFLTPLVPKRRKQRQLFVYDAHNVESFLARDMFGKGPWGRAARWQIHRLEKQLVREADVITTTSVEDAHALSRLYKKDFTKFMVIPNGVDIDDMTPCPSIDERNRGRHLLGCSAENPTAFFIGSFHPPNVEAVDFIIRVLATRYPEVDFLIAGKVCQAFESQEIPPNARLLGLVSEEQKKALFWSCDVAINPMMSGSGTNLKMLEYLASGLPIVSTTVGARGLDATNRENMMIASSETFASVFEEVLTNASLRATLSENARSLAVERFSWKAIGDDLADLYTLRTNKRILILNDYDIAPADQGGKVRIDYQAKTLAKTGASVCLLTLTTSKEPRRLQTSDRLEELNIPRSSLHRLADAIIANLAGSGCDDASALLLTRWLSPGYKRALQRELRRADAVLFNHPYMADFLRDIPSKLPVFYDSHNTEFDLKEKLYKEKNFLTKFLIKKIYEAETRLVRQAKATFCVSEENRNDLKSEVPESADRLYVSPNGVDCFRMKIRDGEERRALRREVGFGREFVAIFLGSGHPPNAEAARHIIERTARDHPRVLFLLVGSVCGWFWNTHVPGNVLLMGIVSTEVKDYLLQISDFALNPMMTGSGTSLKLFDYMAAGLPILSTDVGLRGLTDEEKEQVISLDIDRFSEGLRDLLKDNEKTARLRRNARKLAEERFDWSVTLKPTQEVIAEALGLGPVETSAERDRLHSVS